MIAIPCLYNNPENNTYQLAELGVDIDDSDLLVRDIYFINIDNVQHRVDEVGNIIGSIIVSGGFEYYSLLSAERVLDLIEAFK